ncbi:MAG: hypothetical protein AB7V46_18505 [Thermomicrobiales bacterium]
MSQAIRDEAVIAATDHSLSHWYAFLETHRGSEMSHKEIAELLRTKGGVVPWWSQMLTVAYEQHIGRRVPGQDCDGEFSVSVSKTLNGMSMDEALAWWERSVAGKDMFADIPISRGPDTSMTEKWRYWRAGLADGSAINVNIYEKAPGKASLSVQHVQLESTDHIDHWRAHWKDFLRTASRA